MDTLHIIYLTRDQAGPGHLMTTGAIDLPCTQPHQDYAAGSVLWHQLAALCSLAGVQLVQILGAEILPDGPRRPRRGRRCQDTLTDGRGYGILQCD